MPRTPITENPLAINTGTAVNATNVDPTNDHEIAVGRARHLLLDINATFAGAKTYTIKAGAYPPSWKAGQGDLILSLNAVRRMLVIDVSRFAQADGKVYIDVEAAATGTITAYRLPKGL